MGIWVLKFVLKTILIKYDDEAQKKHSYFLECDEHLRVVITTVPGSLSQYDLAHSKLLCESIADQLFIIFMDTLESLLEQGDRLYLGQVFEI